MYFRRGAGTGIVVLMAAMAVVGPLSAAPQEKNGASAGRVMWTYGAYGMERDSLAAMVLGYAGEDEEEVNPLKGNDRRPVRTAVVKGATVKSGAGRPSGGARAASLKAAEYRAVRQGAAEGQDRAEFNSAVEGGLRIWGKAQNSGDVRGRMQALGDMGFETQAGSGGRLGFSGMFTRGSSDGKLKDTAQLQVKANPWSMLSLKGEMSSSGYGGYKEESKAGISFETSKDWQKKSGLGISGMLQRQEKNGQETGTTGLKIEASPLAGLLQIRGEYQGQEGASRSRATKFGIETGEGLKKLAGLQMSGNMVSQDTGGVQSRSTVVKAGLEPVKGLSLRGEMSSQDTGGVTSRQQNLVVLQSSLLKYMDIKCQMQGLAQAGQAYRRQDEISWQSNARELKWNGLTLNGKYMRTEQGETEQSALNMNMGLKPLKLLALQGSYQKQEGSVVGERLNTSAVYTLPNFGSLQWTAMKVEDGRGSLESGQMKLEAKPFSGIKVNGTYGIKEHLEGQDALRRLEIGLDAALTKKLGLYGSLTEDEIASGRYYRAGKMGIKGEIGPGLSLAGDYRQEETDGQGSREVYGLHLQKQMGPKIALLYGIERSAGSGSGDIGSYAGISANPLGKVQVSYKRRLNELNATLAGMPVEELKLSAPLARTANKNLEVSGNLQYVDADNRAQDRLSGNLALTYKPQEDLSLSSNYRANVNGGVAQTEPLLTWEAKYNREF